jgi:hypothetical protein
MLRAQSKLKMVLICWFLALTAGSASCGSQISPAEPSAVWSSEDNSIANLLYQRDVQSCMKRDGLKFDAVDVTVYGVELEPQAFPSLEDRRRHGFGIVEALRESKERKVPVTEQDKARTPSDQLTYEKFFNKCADAAEKAPLYEEGRSTNKDWTEATRAVKSEPDLQQAYRIMQASYSVCMRGLGHQVGVDRIDFLVKLFDEALLAFDPTKAGDQSDIDKVYERERLIGVDDFRCFEKIKKQNNDYKALVQSRLQEEHSAVMQRHESYKAKLRKMRKREG